MAAKIVLFEDEENVRELVLEILTEAGYSACHINGNGNVVNSIIAEKPDLIISDIMMPGKTGIDIFNEVKGNEETQNIPFIFLTAKSDYNDIRFGMSIGADDYILKPFKSRDLIRSVELRLAKIRRLNEKLTNFSLNVALHIPHELRTPLIAILGYTDLILDDYKNLSDTEILESVRSINRSGQRLHKVIEKFILYSDILSSEMNNTYLKRFVSDSLSGIDDLIEMYAVNAASFFGRAKDIVFKLEPYRGRLTDESVSIVITQLLENACRYSCAGTPVVVSGNNINTGYCISVKDSGQGMSKEQIADINPMRQFNRGLENMSGNGLGLAIVRKILSFVNSELAIVSKPGGGTIVSFILN